MNKGFVAITLFIFLIACSGNKNNNGNDAASVDSWYGAFPQLSKSFSISDTAYTDLPDSSTIDYSEFARHIPDTFWSNLFKGEKNVQIHPVGRKTINNAQYLVTYLKGRLNQAVYVFVMGDKDTFNTGMPLLVNTTANEVNTATIDHNGSVTISRNWKAEDENLYARTTYGYTPGAGFTVVLNETNDTRNSMQATINHLDTMAQSNKYSGNYFKNADNVLYIRDGKDTGSYIFFVHFENNNNQESCTGNLRGQLTMTSSTTGIYRESNDPCVVDFTFKGKTVNVKEQGSCGNYRGIKCFFNDTYTKKAALTSKKQ